MLNCTIKIVGCCMIQVELAEGWDDAAINVANDMVTEADG